MTSIPTLRRVCPALFSLALAAATGCGPGAEKPDVTVGPGQSIQEAVNSMPPTADHWIVEVLPGTYKETVAVDRAGVELRGSVKGPGDTERPILDGSLDGGRMRKDAVLVSGAHFTISGFLVKNYSGNGVATMKTHHVTFRDLITDTAGKYGMYPVESEDILIENCVARNIADAGIYVGQSKRAVVRNNKAYANVAGIEIENTVDALVEGNEAYDNASGILAFVLPNNPSKVGQLCTVRNNNVHDNNHKNFGDPTATVSKVPPGMGMLIMGADETTVTGNTIANNHSVGIAVVGLAALFSNPTMLDVEPNTDGTKLLANTYTNNGKQPTKEFLDLAKDAGITMGGDLLWDGTGKNNCQDDPKYTELATLGIPMNRCR